MDRQQLLAIVAASWQALDTAIDGLDEHALAEPNVVGPWSIVEVLGHVTAWEQQALRHIERWPNNEPMTMVGGSTVDDYNAAEAERRRGWSLAEIRAEHYAARQRLQAAVEALSDADWSRPHTLGQRTTSLSDIVAGDLGGDGPGDHAAEHARQIQEWRRAKGRG
jgi:DinB superfamily